ncbi:hypothetical protein CN947_03575 [Bacillus cereus]|nr:hypothetical protein CN947_03575 [Bacillus cereus]
MITVNTLKAAYYVGSLFASVEKYGFTHDKVISLSQDLDRLLNLLTKLNTSVSRLPNTTSKEKRCSF